MTLPEFDVRTATPCRPVRRLRRLGLVLLLPATMVAGLALATQSAAVNPPGPHDPIGKVEKVSGNPDGSVHFVGWAADPDGTANVHLYGLVDGVWVTPGATHIVRSAITKKYHTGPTPGFDIAVPVAKTGAHSVCVAARNIGSGIDRVLRCVGTPLAAGLSAQQQAARSPRGHVSWVKTTSSTMRVRGWAVEPDFVNSRIVTVLYVDGRSVLTVATHTTNAAQRKAGAGLRGAFDITVPVTRGSHLGCVWLVNVGFGSNTAPGCFTADTRGKPGTGTVKTPAANPKVVKEAKRHIGQPYVWGAAGPKKFDCSGLVIYSYHKAGITTPRTAQDQFGAARVIPASRAVAGDLVFYHDGVGSVYHVGIYLAPLDTVAAIDEQEGVAHQHIWDPSSATYGSFTHT